MSKEIDPVYFTNHVNRKLRTSDDLQGEASVHGLSLASTVQIGTVDAAEKIFTLDSTGNLKTSNSLTFTGETGAVDNLVIIQGGLNVESGSGLFVRSASGIRVIGDEDTDTVLTLERYTNSWKAAVHFTPSGTLNAGNAEFRLGFYYGSPDFSLRINTGTAFEIEALKVSAAGLVSIKSGTTISGNTAISGTLTQRGAASFLNDVTVSTNTTVTGNLGVSGATNLNSLDVSGDFVASGLVVKNNVTVTGNIGISGTATIEDLVVNGSSILDGDFGVVGDTTLNTLDVTGAFARVSGATTLNTLTVTGATVGISGASTLNTLDVTGSSTLMSGTLGVSGATTLNTLTSTGATVGLSGALTQRGAASFLNNVTISGNTLVSGNVATSGSITGTSLIKDGYNNLNFNILGGYRNSNPSAFKLTSTPAAPSLGGDPPSHYTVASIEKKSSLVNGANDKQVNGLYVGLTPNSGTISRSELMVAISAQGIASSTATTPFNGDDHFDAISFLALSPKVSERLAGTGGLISSIGLFIEPQKSGSVIDYGIGITQTGSDDTNHFSGKTYFYNDVDIAKGDLAVSGNLSVTGNYNWKANRNFYLSGAIANNANWSFDLVNQDVYTGGYWSVWSDKNGSSPGDHILAVRGDTLGVGINTTDPQHQLDVNGTALVRDQLAVSGGVYLALNQSSPVGIRTNAPIAGFDVDTDAVFRSGITLSGNFRAYGNYSWEDSSNYFLLTSKANNEVFYTLLNRSSFNTSAWAIYDDAASATALSVFTSSSAPNTRVGINTLNPASGLEVNTNSVFNSGVTISGNLQVSGHYYWQPGKDFKLSSTADNQEWSLDLLGNGFTGNYWHVYADGASYTGSVLAVRGDTGRVGIRTTNPAYGLDVNADAIFQSGVYISGSLVASSLTVTGDIYGRGHYYWQAGKDFKAISTAPNQEFTVDLDRNGFYSGTWGIYDISTDAYTLKVESYQLGLLGARSVEINGRFSLSSHKVYPTATNAALTYLESEYYFHYIPVSGPNAQVALPSNGTLPHGTEFIILNDSEEEQSLAIYDNVTSGIIHNGQRNHYVTLGRDRACKLISLGGYGWLFFEQ